MTNVIMHGCNGRMGQMITNLVKQDDNIEIVAGIDTYMGIDNAYPVFSDIRECNVTADAIIDFASANAMDGLLDYCVEKQIPCVLCTTGLSEEQLEKVKDVSTKVAILKSANIGAALKWDGSLFAAKIVVTQPKDTRWGTAYKMPQ